MKQLETTKLPRFVSFQSRKTSFNTKEHEAKDSSGHGQTLRHPRFPGFEADKSHSHPRRIQQISRQVIDFVTEQQLSP
jgi:hypothetical protein